MNVTLVDAIPVAGEFIEFRTSPILIMAIILFFGIGALYYIWRVEHENRK